MGTEERSTSSTSDGSKRSSDFPMSDRVVPDTQRAAWREKQATVETDRQRVLEIIQGCGPYGATLFDVCRIFNVNRDPEHRDPEHDKTPNDLSGRISELLHGDKFKGLQSMIRDSGERRVNPRTNKAGAVYVACQKTLAVRSSD